MEAIGFETEDIVANRNGLMTERQRALLTDERHFWRITDITILAAVPVAVGLTIWDGIRIGDTVSSRIGIVAPIFIIMGTLYIYTHSKWKQVQIDVLEGRVLSIEGAVELKSYRERNGMKYRLSIKKMKFKITGRGFDAFHAGEKYCVYYAPHSKRIMSAVTLPDTTGEP